MTESEKRQHRCCFAGHREESIAISASAAKEWLTTQITAAISEGYNVFITGMGMGVDIWAANIVIGLKRSSSSIHLIAVEPYPGFSMKWSEEWRAAYQQVLHGADLVKRISRSYSPDALLHRNTWMVEHSSCLIGIYNGVEGHTRHLVNLAREKGIKMVLYPFPRVLNTTERVYPLNLIDELMACREFQLSQTIQFEDLPLDFERRLRVVIGLLPDEGTAEKILMSRFKDRKSLDVIGAEIGMSGERIGQLMERYLKKLRQPDLMRFLNCHIEGIPEKSSKTMMRRLEQVKP